jgi:hypothetical protein
MKDAIEIAKQEGIMWKSVPAAIVVAGMATSGGRAVGDPPLGEPRSPHPAGIFGLVVTGSASDKKNARFRSKMTRT